jgi:hypothetical protein
VYAHLLVQTSGPSIATAAQALPVIRGASEDVTSASSQRLLYLDGLDQSVEASRGNRWSLILTEVAGARSELLVRLYEAGNRTSPIAEKTFVLSPRARLKMDNVFAALDLDNDMRRKDRANMMLSVVSTSGGGVAAAVALSSDNTTGDGRSYVLRPSSGGPVNLQKATVVQSPPPTRRTRAVKR